MATLKSFLIPVSAAVAALFPGKSPAMVSQPDGPAESTNNVENAEARTANADAVVGKMLYEIGNEEHALALRRPAHGVVYADHQSHASHSSHSSHRSGS